VTMGRTNWPNLGGYQVFLHVGSWPLTWIVSVHFKVISRYVDYVRGD